MSYNNNNNDTTQRLDVLDPANANTNTTGNTTAETAALANSAGYRSVGHPVGESVDAAAERISHQPGDNVAGDAASGRAAVGVPPPRSSEMNTQLGSGATGSGAGAGAGAGAASYLGAQSYGGNQGYGSGTGTGDFNSEGFQRQTSGVLGSGSDTTNASNTGNSGYNPTPGSYDTTAGSPGNVSGQMSEKTRRALQKDPQDVSHEEVLSTQPKSSGKGEPIVDPISHRPENKQEGEKEFSRTGGAGNGQFGPNSGQGQGQGQGFQSTERGGTYGGVTGAQERTATNTAQAQAGERFGTGSDPFADNTRSSGGGAGNLGTSDMNATSGSAAQGNTSGWSAGAGATGDNSGNFSSSGYGSTTTGQGASTLPASQQPTASLIGPEPKWKNASSSTTTTSAPNTTDTGGGQLPPMGIDTQTPSGTISDTPSARTRAALDADPSNATTHSVLGSEPKSGGRGEPIVPPTSERDDEARRGFSSAQGQGQQGAGQGTAYAQSSGLGGSGGLGGLGGAGGAGGGQGRFEGGSSDPTRPTGEGFSSGVGSEPSARTRAALGQRD